MYGILSMYSCNRLCTPVFKEAVLKHCLDCIRRRRQTCVQHAPLAGPDVPTCYPDSRPLMLTTHLCVSRHATLQLLAGCFMCAALGLAAAAAGIAALLSQAAKCRHALYVGAHHALMVF